MSAVVVLAALAILPLLIPAAELRRAAAEAISGATTREVSSSSEPVLKFLPSPRVVLAKVTFPLTAGQSLDAEEVVSRIDLWPLLLGRVRISDVTLVRPTLILTGRGSLPAVAAAPLLLRTDRPEMRIVDGTIAWRSPDGLTEELVSGIEGSLDRILDGKGIALIATFDWRDTPVEARLSVDDVAAFLAGSQTPTRLAVSSDEAMLRFRGRAAFADSPSVDGELTADVSSLRHLLEWTGAGAPPEGRGFGPFSLAADFSLADGAAALTQVKVSLDGNRSEGALLVKLADDRPMIQGTFAAEKLSLQPYGRMHLTSANGLEWSRDPIDLSLLDAVDLDLRLSAGQVTADGTTFSTVAASAVLRDGRLVLALGQTSGWGGMLRASATLFPLRGDAATDTAGASLQVEGECDDISLENALDDMIGLPLLDGTGTLQFDLRGEGLSVAAIAQSLSGQVTLASRGGNLMGVDVAQVLRRIERRPLSGAADMRGGRTAFTTLDAKATLQKGVATIERMELAGSQVRLTIGGTVAIGARLVDLSGAAVLAGAGRAGAPADVDLPFVVQGPWSAPRIMADPLSLIERSGAAQPLLEAAKNRRGTAAAVHSVIENLVKPGPALPASAGAGAAAN